MRPLFITLTAVLTLLVVASYAGEIDPWFDLASHFRLYYGILGLVLIGIATGISRRVHRGWFVLLSILVVSQGAAIAKLHAPTTDDSGAASRVRVMHWNVFGRNPHHERVVDLVARVGADVVTLQEVAKPIVDALESRGFIVVMSDRSVRRGTDHGNAILVRDSAGFRVVGERYSRPIHGRGQTFLSVTLEHGPLCFDVASAHLPPPNHEKNRERRPRYLASLVRFLAETRNAIVFCGDLNTTPFSVEWDRITANRFDSAADGRGYQPTWPVSGWRRPFRIPIDHVLLSRHFRATRYEVLDEAAGSDHFPIVCELAWSSNG